MPDLRDLDDLIHQLQKRHPVFFTTAVVFSAMGASAVFYLLSWLILKLR